MALSRLEIGQVNSEIIFAKTNAEVAQILEWFILGWADAMPEGLTVAQQNKWKLDQAHKKMLAYVQREARANRLTQLRAASTSLEQQAEQETSL